MHLPTHIHFALSIFIHGLFAVLETVLENNANEITEIGTF